MFKLAGWLFFIVLVWLGLTLYVGEPDPWTRGALERIGFYRVLPHADQRSVGQRARSRVLEAYRQGAERAWIDEEQGDSGAPEQR